MEKSRDGAWARLHSKRADKTTGKGRLGQGERGLAGSGLLLPQEDLTHPPDLRTATQAGKKFTHSPPESLASSKWGKGVLPFLHVTAE